MQHNQIINTSETFEMSLNKGGLIMGNSLKTKKGNSVANSCNKSKGERLGWKSTSEYKAVSLKEIIGNGKVVSDAYDSFNASIRLVP